MRRENLAKLLEERVQSRALLEETRRKPLASQQEQEQLQARLNEAQEKLLASRKDQAQSHVSLRKVRQALSKSEQEKRYIRTRLSETEGKLCACVTNPGECTVEMSRTVSSEQPAEVIRRRLHAENTIRDLERKLDATEQRNTKHYVAQKMLEQEVQCSKDLLESVKSRLSTSEAALN